MYEFSLRAISSYFELLPGAVVVTLWLSILTILLSTVVGVVGVLCRVSRLLLLRFVGTAYVEVLRNIPLLVVIYLVFFGLAQLGLLVNGFNSALIALTLNAGAYMTEIFRGGLVAIPRGQYEAARSQGMTAVQLYRHIVFPQVFRIVYAPLGNLFIGIGVEELATWMHLVGDQSFRYLEVFVVAALVYIGLAQGINVARLATGRVLLRSAPGGGHR